MKMGASARNMKFKQLTGHIEFNDLVRLEKLKRDIEENPAARHKTNTPNCLDQINEPLSYSKVRSVSSSGVAIDQEYTYN
jgi:hypothetical protein